MLANKMASMEIDNESEVRWRKRDFEYENCSERFYLKERQFSRQYAHIYSVRLNQMRASVTERAKKKWGATTIKKLFQLTGEDRCVIIGTLFKQMAMKPSILKEISEEHHLVPQPHRTNFVHEHDVLILEDELQRIGLIGDLDVHNVVTGIVVAVLGKEEDGGKFIVEDYCFTSIPKQISRLPLNEDVYVALVSGLGLGTKADCLFSLELLIDLLGGVLGETSDQEQSGRVIRLVIAGNSLSQSTQDKDFANKAKYLSRNVQAGSVDAIKTLDDFLEQLSSTIDIDLMPGEFDPCNYMLPQQPLHGCMFPKTRKQYSSLHMVTNPYEAKVAGVRFLGVSGQSIDNVCHYSKVDDPLEIMANTLDWGHLAPTAPDTLGCYPYYDSDPFIITSCPDVYFVGNQAKFSTKMYTGGEGQQVRLVTVPRFSDSHTCVLVNLKTLECESVSFDDSHLEKFSD